jgi:flagellar basal body-associated protein FliL
MARTPGLEKTGNWRLIQKLDGQNPKIIKGPAPAGSADSEESSNTALIIFMILFIVTTVMFCGISIYFYNQANEALASKSQRPKKEAEFTNIENADTATKKEDGA